MWVVFTSRRMYGSVATISSLFCSDSSRREPRSRTSRRRRFLGKSAIDLSGNPVSDASHPAFYLPAQEILAGNSRGFWSLDPCKGDGSSCTAGDECCNGYCEPDMGGALVCSNTPPNGMCLSDASPGQVHHRRRLLRHDEPLRQRLLHAKRSGIAFRRVVAFRRVCRSQATERPSSHHPLTPSYPPSSGRRIGGGTRRVGVRGGAVGEAFALRAHGALSRWRLRDSACNRFPVRAISFGRRMSFVFRPRSRADGR